MTKNIIRKSIEAHKQTCRNYSRGRCDILCDRCRSTSCTSTCQLVSIKDCKGDCGYMKNFISILTPHCKERDTNAVSTVDNKNIYSNILDCITDAIEYIEEDVYSAEGELQTRAKLIVKRLRKILETIRTTKK